MVRVNLTPFTATLGLSGLPLQFAVAFTATCAFWLFGYDMSNYGGLVTLESFLTTFPELRNANVLGIVVACFELGALVGAIACLEIGDRLGRRSTVLLGMLMMLIGAILQTCAFTVGHLVAARVIGGVGLGLQVATVPSWQSECAKPHSRGRWVMVEGGLQTSGVACGQWMAPAVIVLILINFLPESPRWLFKHKMHKEGTYVLMKLRGLPEDHQDLVAERAEIIATTDAQEAEEPFRYLELLQGGKTKTFYRVAIGFFVQSAQQLSGINLVSTYANKILGDSFDLSGGLSHLVAACGGTEYALCSLISVFLIEGLGRRKALIGTCCGMAVSMAVVAGLQSTGERKLQLAGVGFLFLFNTFFGLAWVGGPFLYSAEIAPLRCRVQANAIASAGNWLFCFIVVMIVPPAIANIGWRTYIIFAILNASFVPVMYFFLVETKQRSLECLDVIFASSNNPVKAEKSMPADISIEDMRRMLGLDSHSASPALPEKHYEVHQEVSEA